MKIELRKFTANEKFSEETLMFCADLYLDGKKVGTVENDGHGGPSWARYNDPEAGKRIAAWIKTLPPEVSKWDDEGNPISESGKPGTLIAWTEDFFFSDLAEKMQRAKHEKRALAKRQKFAAAARTRGMVAFYAEWSSGSMRTELVFEVRPVYDCAAGSMLSSDEAVAEAATKYATTYASKKKVAGALVKVEMLRSAP